MGDNISHMRRVGVGAHPSAVEDLICASKKPVRLLAIRLLWLTLKDDANQAAATLVDDALYGLLKLYSRVGGHPVKLVAQPLVDKLVQRCAKYIGVPDLFRVFGKIVEQEHHKLLALLFAAYNR